MAFVENPFKCDICKTKKGTANHWWLRELYVNCGTAAPHTKFILLPQWDDALADQKISVIINGVLKLVPVHEHLCSESCCSKSLSKFMGKPIVEGAQVTLNDV